jgi:glycosyltransferase involved in cell wall biosynthesis
MAQGRVFIASDVGGHKELVRDGETGRLFAADDPTALAAAVEDMLAQRTRWPEYRTAGRRFVEAERNWRNSVANYRDVYTGLLGCKPA